MATYIHTAPASVVSILTLGYIPGGGSRASAANNRQGWERDNCPESEYIQPSYGAYGASHDVTRASIYGSVALKLCESLDSYSTCCLGDSLIKGSELLHISQAADLYYRSSDEFVEVQVWAPVTPKTIEEVIYLNSKPSEEVKSLCKQLNIKLTWYELIFNDYGHEYQKVSQ